MALNYITTCQPPTSVTASVSGRFMLKSALCLAVAKYNRFELYAVTENGLDPILQLNIHGKITNLASYRQKHEQKDFIIMLTESLNISVLEYDQVRNMIITRCSGNINDRLKRNDSGEPILRVDPTNSYALIRVFDGILKIISLDVKGEGTINMYNVRLNELYTYDVTFLSYQNSSYLHIGLIYKDRLSRNFRSYLLRTKDMELRDGPLAIPCIEDTSTLILPVDIQNGWAVIVGKETVVHVGNSAPITTSPSCFVGEEVIHIATQIGRKKHPCFLLGDAQGNLFVLSVLKDVNVSYVGNVGFPSTMSYIDKGVVFIGSCLSDSQLIRLNKQQINNSYVTVLESYVNIAPIVDMEIFDRHHQDVPRLVTCSGTEKWGSLRVLTNGVQVNDLSILPLKRFKATFALMLNFPGDGKHDSLLLSDFNSTILLRESVDGFSVNNNSCFIYDSSTIFAGNVVHSQILQISRKEARLIQLSDMIIVTKWNCNSECISHSSCNGWQFILCTSTKVHLFNISDGKFDQINAHSFNQEISCLSIYFIKFLSLNNSTVKNGMGIPNIMAVSFWNDTDIELYSLPNFDLITKDIFEEKTLFRSIVFMEFRPNVVHLLASMGTGDIFIYELSKPDNLLSVRTKSHLGTSPLHLIPIRVKGSILPIELVPGGENLPNYPLLGEPNVFSCSDRASIIHFNLFKVGLSYTNKQNIDSCCAYNSSFHENSIVLITPEEVSICRISDICTYSIVSIPIYESPRKIVYQQENSVFGLITVRLDSLSLRQEYSELPRNQRPFSLRIDSQTDDFDLESNQQIEISSFQIINQDSFEPIFVHNFPFFEIACSLLSCKLIGRTVPLFAVGTGIVTEIQQEPSCGRVVLFQYCDRDLTSVSDYPTKGAVYCIIEHNGRLVCCVSHSVLVLTLRSDNNILCLHEISNNVTSLYAKSLNHTVIVGDLIRSLTVYNANDHGDLDLLGKSGETNWLTAIEIIDKNNFLYSNMDGCLFIGSKPSNIDEDSRGLYNLCVTLCFNLDQQVNVFKRGSLLCNISQDKNIRNKHSILFGCVSGMIGVVLDVPSPWNKTLEYIQTKILATLDNIGDIDYLNWRNYFSQRYNCKQILIDGDLLEGFLHLHMSRFKEIIASVEDHFNHDTPIEKRVDQ
ncbi:hypothetical protein HZS_3878, partial [Henneguya salminicola]